MTFFTFVYKNAFRNKRRTSLTILSIGFSLFLLVIFQTFIDMFFNPPLTDKSNLRLAVKRTTSIMDAMPMAYGEKLRKVPHITEVVPFHWFGGMYKDSKNFFANFGTDPEKLWAVFPDFEISQEEMTAFRTDRTGCIAGEQLMTQFGWKVGDRITLLGRLYPADLDLKIVGTYRTAFRSSSLLFNWDYMNEALGRPNVVGMYWVQADSPAAVPGIIEAVDGMFHNSPAETKTETEKAFILNFSSMMGNIKGFIGAIAGVVVFTMLLVAASTMAMTIRERLREVAILKSIGFPRRLVLSLIMGEAIFISALGALLGCAMAYGSSQVNLYGLTKGFIEQIRVTQSTLLITLAVGLGIGVLSGLWPAIRASGMTITEAIRRLD